MLHGKDWLKAPVYLYQARRIQQQTLRLPEPEGERHGHSWLSDHPQSLSVMIVGDSSAAGVGASSQTQAFLGHFVNALTHSPALAAQVGQLHWSLHATTGHTSFDLLKRLYTLPAQPIDVMVICIGVNDVTKNTSVSQWQQNLTNIITIAKRKFHQPQLIFSGLPPMASMPALPSPLNQLINRQSERLNHALIELCAAHSDVTCVSHDAQHIPELADAPSSALFAEDGFHPSSLTYQYWAQHMANRMTELLINTSSFSTSSISN